MLKCYSYFEKYLVKLNSDFQILIFEPSKYCCVYIYKKIMYLLIRLKLQPTLMILTQAYEYTLCQHLPLTLHKLIRSSQILNSIKNIPLYNNFLKE